MEDRAGRQLSAMTWEEVDALDRDRTVAILPVGAVEAHGPHLPLVTDVVIAEAMAQAAAAQLAPHALTALILPSLSYTPAGFARGFPGTISISESTMSSLLTDIARGVAAHGFRTLAIANAHFDPDNVRALHAHVKTESCDALRIIFPDVTRNPWGSRLTAEFRSGACHAGQYETSILLAARPEFVREPHELEPNPISLSTAIRDGITSFEAAGGARAYFGDPAAATAAEGAETIRVLGSILADAICDALQVTP